MAIATTYSYHPSQGAQECPVCYESFNEGDQITTHTDGDQHPSCKNCFKIWVMKKGECPFCRTDIDPESLFSLSERIEKIAYIAFNYLVTLLSYLGKFTALVIGGALPVVVNLLTLSLTVHGGGGALAIATATLYGSLISIAATAAFAILVSTISGVAVGSNMLLKRRAELIGNGVDVTKSVKDILKFSLKFGGWFGRTWGSTHVQANIGDLTPNKPLIKGLIGGALTGVGVGLLHFNQFQLLGSIALITGTALAALHGMAMIQSTIKFTGWVNNEVFSSIRDNLDINNLNQGNAIQTSRIRIAELRDQLQIIAQGR